MATLLFTHPACADHRPPQGHPERPERLAAVERALAPLELPRRDMPLGAEEAILRAHPSAHLAALRAACPSTGEVALDPDTWMSRGSLEAAFRAVGGAVAAVDAVLDGEATNAFVAARPPGHHAERSRPMGFCLLGTVAIAALHALEARGLSRVAVLDFDVHHGNGTQDLLWDEPRIRFVSSQQMPLWPGTGGVEEVGAHGQITNLPLRPGSGGVEMMHAWQPEFDRLAHWQPELVLVSAGFDAHRDDPLAGLRWTEADFARLTRAICTLAADSCAGRVVSVLEGGYDLEALGASVAAHVGELVGAAR